MALLETSEMGFRRVQARILSSLVFFRAAHSIRILFFRPDPPHQFQRERSTDLWPKKYADLMYSTVQAPANYPRGHQNTRMDAAKIEKNG